MEMTSVIIKWTVGNSYEQVCESEEGNGIYLFTGKTKGQRDDRIQYCGITEKKFCDRINEKHHKLSLIREDTLSIWLGEILYPNKFKRVLLENAESLFVSYWQPPLNDRKKTYFPREPICFISQWFKQDGEPYFRRPTLIANLPDILWWDTERWRTGKLTVWYPED
jgi:hypothetical protein